MVSLAVDLPSLPVWEEWIEIGDDKMRWLLIARSLPVWEEWIEMLCGQQHGQLLCVSSRMGRVD